MGRFRFVIKAGRVPRPLLWACVFFMLGIAASPYVRVTLPVFWGAAGVTVVVSALVRKAWIVMPLILLVMWLAGAVYPGQREAVFPNDVATIPYYLRRNPVVLEGLVVSDVEPRSFFRGTKTVFSLSVQKWEAPWGWLPKRGVVLVNLFGFCGQDIRYGDYLRLEGKLHRPFNFSKGNRFSYRDYLSRKGISFILSVKKTGRVEVLQRGRGQAIKDWSLRVKHRLAAVIKKNFNKEEAGLMLAFLLGDRYDIPKDVYDLFKVSGVAHIIAISGFNVGIVAAIVLYLLRMFPISRAAQHVLTMAFLVFYAFLTGGQPPVVRATIMAVVFLTSVIVEREQESINTLSLAAVLILLINPKNLFDAGFQLSFLSVFSIILFYREWMKVFSALFPRAMSVSKTEQQRPRWKRWAAIRARAWRYFFQSMALSLAAYAGVVPLLAYYFHLITPVVLLANLVVVPLASGIICLGIGLLLVGSLIPFGAFIFAKGISLLIQLMVASIAFFSRMPGAYFEIGVFPWWGVTVYYAIFACFFIAIKNAPPRKEGFIDLF